MNYLDIFYHHAYYNFRILPCVLSVTSLLSVPLLWYSMGQIIITSVILSFCLSVCKHSYCRNFDSILMKFCTVIWGPKSKIEFVWDKNLITSSSILLQFLNWHYGLWGLQSGSL